MYYDMPKDTNQEEVTSLLNYTCLKALAIQLLSQVLSWSGTQSVIKI